MGRRSEERRAVASDHHNVEDKEGGEGGSAMEREEGGEGGAGGGGRTPKRQASQQPSEATSAGGSTSGAQSNVDEEDEDEEAEEAEEVEEGEKDEARKTSMKTPPAAAQSDTKASPQQQRGAANTTTTSFYNVPDDKHPGDPERAHSDTDLEPRTDTVLDRRKKSILTSNASDTKKYYPRHWGHLVSESKKAGRGRSISLMYKMGHPDISEEALLKDDRTDMLAATSVLQQQAAEIRAQKVNWQSYLQSHMISQEDYTFIVAYENSDSAGREALLKENRAQCAKTFLNLLGHISKDQTIRYILVLIDDMLQEDPSRVEIFKEHAMHKKESVWTPFLNLLNRPDGFIQNMTSRIIAKIACWSKETMERSDLHFYLTWLKDQLKIQNNEYMQSVARCLQMMLRVDEYRFAFVAVDGISTILTILQSRLNFQIQYQLIFCLWVLTFNPLLAEKMNKFNVIPILADILSDSVKEKVTRIILAVFRNLIEKPEDPQVSKEHCIAMVQCKVLKQLNILHQRKFDDEDISNDIQFLDEKLQASVQDLSSFDEYATEVKSGRLEWSPVHKSAKFWRENAPKLNEKNYELLRILIHLLEQSRDPLVLSVASYDIGEYVRHYPRGKNVIEQLGGKQLVMQLLSHDDPNVRYEALLAVQKLMVHNWEYLGKQLEKDKDSQGPKTAGAAKA